MIVALVILGIVAVIALVQIVRYERELRRMARFLDECPAASNARMTVRVHTRGATRLACAMNEKLDEIQSERQASGEREREVQATLTALSHDIRTPLAGAQGYLQLLDEEDDDVVRARYLESVARRQADVRDLLDELYAYAQTQDPERELVLEPVDVGIALGEALVAFYPQFKEKDWEPDVSLDVIPCRVEAEPDALARMFRNLVSNALRYGVSAPRIVQHNTEVVFANRVADPALIDTARLFDRFYRGSQARVGQGSGLGLAIVAELAGAMGASVHAELVGDELRCSLTFKQS